MQNGTTESGLNNRLSLSELVISQIQRYARCLSILGYPHVVDSRSNFARIRNHLLEFELENALAAIGPALSVAEEIIESEENVRKTPSELELLKHFLMKAGLRRPENFEDYVLDSDIIEVYDRQAIQCYRSFNFFEICSYTLEEIFTFPWWNLYERNPFVTRKIGNICTEVFEKNHKSPIPVNVPVHVAREIWSPGKTTLKIQQKFIYPLENESGKVTHTIANFSILERIAGEHLTVEGLSGTIQVV